MIENLDYATLQQLWWLICSVVGALFLFLTFVQGGQTLLWQVAKTDVEKGLVINDPITAVEAKIEQDVPSGMWDIHSTNNQLRFEEDENGKIKNLLYYENIFFRKEVDDEI